MVTAEANLRIPAVLMPSYLKLTSTEEGKAAEKRVRVFCGICKETRYYSIHRGVTRMAGVVLACEACRHYYQKFKRQPCILRCKSDGSCYVLGDNSKSRCKACWIAHILRICPFPEDVYQHLLCHLPPKIKNGMGKNPPTVEEVSEDDRGALGLEIMQGDEWADVTVLKPDTPPPEDQPQEDPDEDSSTTPQDTLVEAEGFLEHQEQTTSDTLDNYASDCPEARGTPLQSENELSCMEGVREIERETMRWWMEEEAGTRYTHAEASTTLPCHTTEDTGPSSTGLTPLTPLQPAAAGLTTLTPLQLPHHPTHQNGFHHNDNTVLNVKQEYDCWQDGESEEAQLFRKISVKREFYNFPQDQEGSNMDLHKSPYFTHLDLGSHLDIGLISQGLVTGPTTASILTPTSPPTDKSETPKPKRRRKPKPKIKVEETGSKPVKSPSEKQKRNAPETGDDGQSLPSPSKQRKKLDRFNGVPEEEVAKKKLPDHLGPNLDILIIGINPGLTAAHRGHHYAGPGNHFWKCMYLSGLIPEPFTADDDFRLLEYGIGFTNIVERTTRGSADLTRTEIKQGGKILLTKLKKYNPLIAVFNGKGIYEIYSGKKEFCFGRQPEKIEGTNTWEGNEIKSLILQDEVKVFAQIDAGESMQAVCAILISSPGWKPMVVGKAQQPWSLKSIMEHESGIYKSNIMGWFTLDCHRPLPDDYAE
ncbi:hypothetical protein Pcinc_018152 [Petrolisthes cinctipes]|uniref:G/T mismatch-specific thymine DNA glycosylase n=1 Tax=Petrolisthes cinctipes TaxID=88211 RepID=A0AAE1KN21_PETCI|nr:hypothetical protein Pcinc_018152 [Petrolisthes cinctipes]